MTNTRLGLLRHGQTDWNINFLLQGATDVPMNDTGRQQIHLASKAIARSDWDIVLTSPLSRARQTAEILSGIVGFEEIVEEPLLIERSFGVAEGLSHEQWKASFSSLDEIPGGESRSQLEQRTRDLLSSIASEYAGKRVLAVSHGALIRTVLALVSNNELPREGERLGNASLNVVSHQDTKWRVSNYRLEPLEP